MTNKIFNKIGLNQDELKQVEDLLIKSNDLQLIHIETIINIKKEAREEYNSGFDNGDSILNG